jgi:acetate kinase
MKILTINSGSSSLKFSIYRIDKEREKLERKGELTNIGQDSGLMRVEDGEGSEMLKKDEDIKDHEEAFTLLFDWLKKDSPEEDISGIGHRIVHGGAYFIDPILLNKINLTDLDKLKPLAPEHLPHELKAIKIVNNRYPELKQAACFDTGFHSNMPIVSRRYPIPDEYRKQGIRRYGFHGLSYEYIMQELQKEEEKQIHEKRIIIAHLGNGASMSAIKNSKSIDTTMGFTPAGGLIMSTRTGDLDPGVMIYLMKEKGMHISDLNKLVNEKSGLLGISGESSSMKDLINSRDEGAKLAVEMFCYQARKYLGAFISVLGGLDMLVFTAGIGENSPKIRDRICSNSDYAGIIIDNKRNKQNERIISSNESRVTVKVMKTNEELMIARHTWRLISEN